MKLLDLVERVKELALELKGRIEETAIYQTLKERFETLSPRTQQTAIWSTIGVFSLMVVSCPYGYYSTSNEDIKRFDDIRKTMRALLSAAQVANQLSGVTPDLEINVAQSRMQSEVQNLGLQPEQIGSVSIGGAIEVGELLAPTSIIQNGLFVELKKLNLRQVVEVGHRLQSLQGTLKLAGLDMKTSSDNDHYFDVTYRLINFSLGGSAPSNTKSAINDKSMGPPNRPGQPHKTTEDTGSEESFDDSMDEEN
jgi:hypothetical protein